MDDLDFGQTIRGFAAGERLFGRYVLRSILGRGGMGIVWRAFDEQLDRDVALKFLPELIIHDRAVLDDLKRETKRSLELTHHNIVRIYDFAQDGESACISMEFVDGETLSALRVDHPNKVFEAEELSKVVAEICEALTYAHTRASIVHRDLKPTNLMLSAKGVVKITDFGIARSLSDSVSMLTMNRGTSGTLLYMSPQQLDGDRPSALDDIYSLGATFYELLTSKPPFFTGSIERQIHDKTPPMMAVRRSDLGIRSTTPIPEHWEQTIAACLAKNPADRPQSAAELANRFRGVAPARVMSVPTPPAPPISPPAPAAPPPIPRVVLRAGPARSWKLFIFGVGACLLLALAGLVLYLRLGRSSITKTEQFHAQQLAAPPAALSTPSPEPVVTPEQIPASTPVERTAQTSARYDANAGYDPAIAFVDMNRVFKEYNITKDAEAKINQAKSAAKKEYDDRADAYKKALDEINSLNKQLNAPGLSADAKSRKARERDDKITEIKKMEKEITDFRTTREKQLQEQALKMREGIVKEITAQIKSLAGTVDNMIFDKSGMSLNGVPIVMFSPGGADMSSKVITALNQSQSSSFPATRAMTFALVDMNRVFKEYNITKDAEAKINQAKSAAKKEYDDRADSYKKALDEINNLNRQLDAPGLSTAAKSHTVKERDDKITEIKKMEKEISEFRTTREKQLQEQALKMRQGIVKEITDMIVTGLRSSGEAVLIDISGMSLNGVPIVMFTKGVPDFSDDVITALNQGRTSVRFSKSMASSRTLRFATVDMNRAFRAWPGTKDSEAKINEAKDAAKKEFDDRAASYKNALDEVNRLNRELEASSLSANAKTAKFKERDDKIANIKNMEREINEFRTTREKQLQEQALKMREGIVGKITPAVKTCAERAGFNLVFDSSGNSLNGVPIVLLTHNLPDLTDDVLR
jgi:serine/threonine protein kinase/Skp family chaperone for outer membrane proteins